MLSIWYDDHSVKDLHLGSATERSRAPFVSAVQAEGDELEAIRYQFPGLVIPKHAIVRWYGDQAKFIVGNLKL